MNSFTYIPNGNLITVGTINGKGGDIANIHGLLDGWIMVYDPKKNVKLWKRTLAEPTTISSMMCIFGNR
ncbi:MAG: hypothetical protein IPG87_14780 [Saprospiraceae bacterium]|nr:hypothetical protein [Candidatus Vicinibacter affinis]